MPAQGPGLRHDAVATKAVLHGAPAIEDNLPGIAFKNAQLAAFAGAITDPLLRTVGIGETFTIMLGGMVEVAAANIVGGLAAAPAGTPLYIVKASNLVTPTAAGAATVKFGVSDAVITARSVVRINTNARDTF